MEYLRISESVKFYNRDLINELQLNLDSEKIEKLIAQLNEISEIERQVELIMDSYEDFIIERSLEEDWYQADSEPSEKLFL